ncbi:MAG: AmmeMemoRadiSam system radical SAM enzyme [Syntrophus sp. (in: bacteria)]|nr:AmmeMemoRadiSam system radical SAM enzyme [Syntrophus sp. (in: bacteria)]
MISRREFLRTLASVAPVLSGLGVCLSEPHWRRIMSDADAGHVAASEPLAEIIRQAPLARFWTSPALGAAGCSGCHAKDTVTPGRPYVHNGRPVKCLLCAHGCLIESGQRGRCRARMNVNGELRSLVYGRPVAINVDPIEKKPFYHFLPGAATYSLATSGCPLRCKFCQNWEISQAAPEDYRSAHVPPEGIVQAAQSRQAPVIAYTYNEPIVFAEYMIDIARIARKGRLRSVLVSCGLMREAPLAEMCEVLDAIKIDLKGYSESFYRQVCSAELKPVLRTIKQVARSRSHLEIVNLVVPTLNDGDAMLKGLIDWITGEIGSDVPVHFSRFHPNYQMRNLPPTPTATLERARDMAIAGGIHYAYIGNIPGHPGNHTCCPACKKTVIRRRGFLIEEMHVKNGRCAFCRQKIAGVWT